MDLRNAAHPPAVAGGRPGRLAGSHRPAAVGGIPLA